MARKSDDNAMVLVKRFKQSTYRTKIKKALPDPRLVTRFLQVAASALVKNPRLAACTEESLRLAVMEAAQLGLVLDGTLGHAFIIPYAYEAKFQLGYKGYIVLAQRNGRVNHVDTQVVYEGDDFDYRYGTREFMDHTPVRPADKRGQRLGAWCKVTYTNGLTSFDFMDRADIEEIRAHAPGARRKDSPWNTNTGEMYRKTPLIRHLKTRGLGDVITFQATQEEMYNAGLGMSDEQRAAEAREVKAELVEREKFGDTMANGQSVEGPKHVDSESEPVHDAAPAALTAKDRSNLIVDHHRYSMAIGRKRLPIETLEGMSDSALTDAVENLRQLAEEKTNAENHAGDDPGDVNPFHD